MIKVIDEIQDHKKLIEQAKESYGWIKSINRRLWLTQHVFKNRPIRVDEWSDFDSGVTSYLDIHIELPPGFHCRWIFTVHSRRAWFREMSEEDAQIKLFHNRKFPSKDFATFSSQIRDNLDTWLESGPII